MPINFKKRREELHLTLEEVGNIVGVGRSTVRIWENGGIAGMRIESLAKYARALQVNPLDIVDPDHSLNSDETIKRTVEVMKHLSETRRERVFGFALSQLEDYNSIDDKD